MVPKTLYAYGTTLEVGIRKDETGRSNHEQFAPVTPVWDPLREQQVSTRWHDRQEEILIEHPKVMNASLDQGPAF